MPYLEIYPMENSADKIAKQLDLVLDAKPTMYAKTRDRYRQLAQSLLQSVSKISSILEEESLISTGHVQNEFNELSSNVEDMHAAAELHKAVTDTRNQISSFTQFTKPSSSHATQQSDSSYISNREILSRFATVLEESSQHEFRCKEVSECAKLIYRWFKCRFTPEFKNPNFKYNIEYLPTWITYIIVLYGYYHSINQTSVLISKFDKWCEEISQDLTNCYAVPYEVYSITKSVQPECFTMCGVVIGDILMDEMYYQLTESYLSNSHVVFDLYPVATLTKTLNPSLLPMIRTRIANRNKLIKECRFTEHHLADEVAI